MAGTVRCFVAMRPGAAAIERLGQVIERLRRHGAAVRWVPPHNLHLTLKFLGAVEAARVDEVRAALRAVEVDGPVRLGLVGLGSFPERGRPRVLWAGLAGDVERVAVLARRIERGMRALGFPREVRPFRAHLTIGRVKDARGLGAVLDDLRRIEVEVEPAPVDGFALYESELGPSGSSYRELERFALA